MAKLKYIDKQGQVSVRLKLSSTERINNNEVTFFSRDFSRGFMRPVPEDSSRILFTGANGIALSKFLKRIINKDQFYMMIAQLIEAYKAIMHYKLHPGKVVLDLDFIFIRENTGELYLIYQPVLNSPALNTGFMNCFGQIASMAKCNPSDRINIDKFMTYAGSLKEFSTAELESYILKASPVTYTIVPRQNYTTASSKKAYQAAPSVGRMPADNNKPQQNQFYSSFGSPQQPAANQQQQYMNGQQQMPKNFQNQQPNKPAQQMSSSFTRDMATTYADEPVKQQSTPKTQQKSSSDNIPKSQMPKRFEQDNLSVPLSLMPEEKRRSVEAASAEKAKAEEKKPEPVAEKKAPEAPKAEEKKPEPAAEVKAPEAPKAEEKKPEPVAEVKAPEAPKAEEKKPEPVAEKKAPEAPKAEEKKPEPVAEVKAPEAPKAEEKKPEPAAEVKAPEAPKAEEKKPEPVVEVKAHEAPKAEEKKPEPAAEVKAPEAPKAEEKKPEPAAEVKAPEAPKAEEKKPEPAAEVKAPEAPKAEEKKPEPATDEKAAEVSKTAEKKKKTIHKVTVKAKAKRLISRFEEPPTTVMNSKPAPAKETSAAPETNIRTGVDAAASGPAPIPFSPKRNTAPPQIPEKFADQFNGDDEGTVVLSDYGRNPSQEAPPAKLIRRSTNETTFVTKSMFTLGKERQKVDYCVTNNKTVSRLHATIYRRNDGCYIVDNASTNGTFINDTRIPAQTEIKLNNGDILKLSNEEFVVILA